MVLGIQKCPTYTLMLYMHAQHISLTPRQGLLREGGGGGGGGRGSGDTCSCDPFVINKFNGYPKFFTQSFRKKKRYR